MSTPRWALEKQFKFEASHVLPNQGGKCARLHGHSWVMWVRVGGVALESHGEAAGMLMDFGELKQHIQPLVDSHLDHYHLNSTTGLPNPTSEALAEWLYDRIHTVLPMRPGVRLLSVRVEETCTSACTYSEED